MPLARPAACDKPAPCQPGTGRKLGRKGRETRERIIEAMLRLAGDPEGPPVTLTGVARDAGVRLPNLYLYFPDMGELVLAALDRVMDRATDACAGLMRARWSDDRLEEQCLRFLRAHYAFWRANARLLQMRNALADEGDARVIAYRHRVTRPLIDMLAAQMDGGAGEHAGTRIATVLMTGIERIATVTTNANFRMVAEQDCEMQGPAFIAELIEAEAEIVCQAIRHRREMVRARPGRC